MHAWLQENSQGVIVGLFAGGTLAAALHDSYGWLTVSFLVTALVLLTITRQQRRRRHW
jgi:hypothetical protein